MSLTSLDRANREDTRERYLKEKNLEMALDYLCRATSRDIFIMLPEKVSERNPYLIKEIKITVERLGK
jgi:hypothetical protein